MTVLFLCWEYPPNGSGIGRYVSEMSAALREAGHRTVVLTSHCPGLPEAESLDNGKILRWFGREELRSERVARLTVEVANAERADWIEVAEHWGEGATLLRLKDRPPVVVKMHYNDVLLQPRYAQAAYGWQRSLINLACLRQWRSLRAERSSLEQANAVIAPCRKMLDLALHQDLRLPSRQGIIPNPIRAIENWINHEADAPTLLMVGRLDIGKGLAAIPGILERLIPDFPTLRLEIAGGDSYARGLGSIRQWFEGQLGTLGDHVTFLGILDSTALDEAYRRAWVVIAPSSWDTFPQVVLESMARSKAIVASPHGGMPEMLAGTLCKVEEPISSEFSEAVGGFLDNAETRLQAGISAFHRVTRYYSPDLIATTYIEMISQWI